MAYVKYSDESENFDKYDEPRLHMETLMKAHLVEFDLSLRILIPFEKAGIRTLGDLTRLSEKQLFAIPQLGTGAVRTIKKLLSDLNLKLRGN